MNLFQQKAFKRFIIRCILISGFALSSSLLCAHESWIEPEQWTLNPNETLTAHIKVGQHFKGDSSPFIKDWFFRFERHAYNYHAAVQGYDGDLPAFQAPLKKQGLHLLLYHSTPDTVYYSKFEKFEKFLKREGLQSILKEHQDRGYPDTGFSETYIRCSKSLVHVQGKSDFKDFYTGMPLEIVASFNPYRLKTKQAKLQLLWKGIGIEAIQVRVFHQQLKTSETEYITNQKGEVTVDLKNPGNYLFNAVHMTDGAFNRGELWTSYWASLTFQIPE